jgi:hypothetical protein
MALVMHKTDEWRKSINAIAEYWHNERQ